MKFSDSIDQILPALKQIQETAEQPRKDSDGYNYKYADLNEVMRCIRDPIASAGCLLTQGPGFDESRYGLTTRLFHVKSGQSVSCFMPLDADLDPQDAGKELSYYRRYSILSLFGLVPIEEQGDAHGVYRRKNYTHQNQPSGEQQTSEAQPSSVKSFTTVKPKNKGGF